MIRKREVMGVLPTLAGLVLLESILRHGGRFAQLLKADPVRAIRQALAEVTAPEPTGNFALDLAHALAHAGRRGWPWDWPE